MGRFRVDLVILNINFLYDAFTPELCVDLVRVARERDFFMGLFEVLNNRTHYNTARVNEVLCKEVQGYDRYAFKTALGQKQHQEALGLVVAKIRDEMVEGLRANSR